MITKSRPCVEQMFCVFENKKKIILGIFNVFPQNIDCGFKLEWHHRVGSKKYPKSMFWSKFKKNCVTMYTPVLLYQSGVSVGEHYTDMSRLMGKPTICICENKGADQLRGNREADQRLCFRYTDSTISLLPKYEISCFYCLL